jgi:small subunit ribosomal protein S16
MSVNIRLRRIGKNPKKHPHFRIAVYERTRNRDGKAIEALGFYSPLTGAVKLNKERLQHWVKNGAQVSQTVKSLIKKAR